MKSRTSGPHVPRGIKIGILVAVGAAVALLIRALLSPGDEAPKPAASGAAVVSRSRPSPSGPSATVGVYDDGNPMAKRWVVFHDASGAVTSAVQTGKDGKAAAPVSAPGLVTVAYGKSIRSLVTVAGVEPNDAITVGEEEDEGGADETKCTAVVSLPGRHPKAARYSVALGVGPAEISPDKPLEMSVVERFVKRGRFQVLAEVFDGSGAPVAFAHGWFGGCTSDGGRPRVDARLPAWSTDYRALSVVVTTAGEDAATLEGKMSLELGGPGDRFERGRQEARLADRTALRFAAPRPLEAPTKLKLAVAYSGTRDRFVLEEERRAVPETLTFDLREHRLPRISDATVDDAGSARPSVRWRMTGEDASVNASVKADAVVVQLTWPETGEHVWTIVLPPDTPQPITLPALPDELASWRPDGRPMKASVALLDASFLEGFAEVKRRGLAALEDPPEAERVVLRWSVTGDLDF